MKTMLASAALLIFYLHSKVSFAVNPDAGRRLGEGTCRPHNSLPVCACDSGHYKDWVNDVCLTCPTGFHQNHNQSLADIKGCKQCGYGRYNNEEGQASCKRCAHGTYSNVLGATACTPCAEGRYLPINMTIISSSTQCKLCHEGYFADLLGSTECEMCVEGRYSDYKGAATCSFCPLGSFSKHASPSDPLPLSSCTKAKVGFYSNNRVDEFPCAAGTHSNVTGASSCTPCPTGKYFLRFPHGAGAACLPCALGSYQSETAQMNCNNCPAGTYGDEIGLSSPCKSCLPGQYTQTGLGAVVACVEADRGHFAPEGGLSEEPCEPGQYTNDTGSTSCFDCSPGFYTNRPRETECHSPLPGYFTTNSYSWKGRHYSFRGAIGFEPCPAGKHGGRCDSCDQCTACLPGRFSNISASTKCTPARIGYYVAPDQPTKEVVCPAGHISPNVGMSSCKICPAGKYTKSKGVECHQCLPGKASASPGYHVHESECPSCQPGYYQPSFNATFCIACKPGMYTAHYGATQCTNARQGYFVASEASLEDTICSPGTYSPEDQASQCKLCPDGHVTEHEGAAKCVPTLAGYVPDENRIHPVRCKSGTIAPGTGNHVCTPCPAGKFTPERYHNGEFCESCPKGSAVNAEGSTVCIMCKPGSYADVEGLKQCKLCEPGRTRSLYEKEMSESVLKRTVVAGQTDFYDKDTVVRTTCHACQPGHFQENYGGDTEKCPPCPQGLFAEGNGATECLPCPWDQFTFGEGAAECQSCLSIDSFTHMDQCMFHTGTLVCLLCCFCSCIVWCCKGCPCTCCSSCRKEHYYKKTHRRRASFASLAPTGQEVPLPRCRPAIIREDMGEDRARESDELRMMIHLNKCLSKSLEGKVTREKEEVENDRQSIGIVTCRNPLFGNSPSPTGRKRPH